MWKFGSLTATPFDYLKLHIFTIDRGILHGQDQKKGGIFERDPM